MAKSFDHSSHLSSSAQTPSFTGVQLRQEAEQQEAVMVDRRTDMVVTKSFKGKRG